MGSKNSNTITVEVIGNASSLKTAMAEVPAVVGGAMDKVGAHADHASEKMHGTANAGEHLAHKAEGVAGTLGKLAGGFVALEVGKEVTAEFGSLSEATAKLETAMKDAGEKSTPQFREELEKAQQAGEHLGFAASDTTESIGKLRLAGVDTARAMEAQNTIQDLAATKHITLTQATDALVKSMQGNQKAMKELNIEGVSKLDGTAKLAAAQDTLTKATDGVTKAHEHQLLALEKAKSTADAYDQAVQKHGEHSAQAQSALKAADAAAANAKTSYEQYAKAQEVASKATENLGVAQSDTGDRTHKLGDVLDILGGKLKGQAKEQSETAAGKFKVLKEELIGVGTNVLGHAMPALSKLADILSGLAQHMNIVMPVMGAMIALFVAFKIAAAVSEVIDATTKAVDVFNKTLEKNPMLLIAAVIAIVVTALVALEMKFHFIEAAASAVFNWLKSNWPLLLDILLGPFGFVIGYVVQHFDQIKTAVSNVIDGIAGVVGRVVDIITTPFKLAFNAIAGIWNNTVGKLSFHIPSWVPLIGGDGFDMPKIPTFHTGGTVPGVRGQEVLALLQAGETVTSERDSRNGGRGHTIHVTANTNADPQEIAHEIAWALSYGAA
ncbi:MAG TPA: hypothetical protein VGQ42_15610 [Candidatus Dormibacteraeota bacterium]|jgi:phage-related protein|nr:hypothetical protein [Candidatus Dormibacteraeota bacterium]